MTASMQAYYAARAREYDRIYERPERQADLRAIEAWLPTRFEGRRVLEIACGTGWWTRRIAPVAASVLGIDAAAQTLEIARTRVPADRVRLEPGDAYRPPRAEPPFDAAFAGFWWSHVPRARLQAFLAALGGVLAPGARVVFLDNRFVEGSSTPIAEVDASGDAWQHRRLDDGSVFRVLKNFPDEATVRAELAPHARGLAWRPWTHYWAVEYVTPSA